MMSTEIEEKKELKGNENNPLTGAELVNPYSEGAAKGEQVERMFDSIAPAYDFMNTAMTFGLHRLWRNRALKMAKRISPDPKEILDIATGTGDLAFRLSEIYPKAKVTGLDLSQGMLDIAEEKLRNQPEEVRNRIRFMQGDSLDMKFADNSFDLITVAYGVRNFEHLRQGLSEMFRVLRPGGALCIIELSVPRNPMLKFGYNLYSRHIIPFVGRMVSGDSRAYTYLPESIAAAPQRDDLSAILSECGFSKNAWRSLTLGAVTYYFAIKPR